MNLELLCVLWLWEACRFNRTSCNWSMWSYHRYICSGSSNWGKSGAVHVGLAHAARSMSISRCSFQLQKEISIYGINLATGCATHQCSEFTHMVGVYELYFAYMTHIYIYMYRVLVEGHHQLYWIYIYIVDLDWTYLDLGFQFQSYMHAFVNPSAWIFMHKFIHGDPLACQV